MAKLAGLNCIRLVWSLEMALKPGAAPPKEALTANPDLVGKSALQVFDAVVKAIADAVSSSG
jgi:endoglucanase